MTQPEESKVKRLAEIEGFGSFYEATGGLVDALSALRKEDADIISERDLAYAVIHNNPENHFPDPSGFVREGIIYMPADKAIMLVRTSPTILFPEESAQSYSDGSNYYVHMQLMKKYRTLARKKSRDNEVLLLEYSKLNGVAIAADNFGKNPITRWLFQDQAASYGRFLRDVGIKDLDFDIDPISKEDVHNPRPHAQHFWHSTMDDSMVMMARVEIYESNIPLLGIKKETDSSASETHKKSA